MILIGLGANLESKYGTPEQALRQCKILLNTHNTEVLSFSSIWKSAPVPISDQPWYYNAACQLKTQLQPLELYQMLAEIEQNTGRLREKRNEARVLDLDILAYNDVIMAGNFILPHPRMHQRAFVLYPLQEIAPNWIHPVTNQNIPDMMKMLPAGQEIEKVGRASQ